MRRSVRCLQFVGWNYRTFHDSFDSELRGVKFIARIRSAWRPSTTDHEALEWAAVRETLIFEIEKICSTRSVLDLGATKAHIRSRLDHIAVREASFSDIVIRGAVGLSVDPRSRDLAISWRERQVEERARLAAELDRLEYLRMHVFGDDALASLWWISQGPEVVNALGNDFFSKALAAAQVGRSAESVGDLETILAEFARSYEGGDSRAKLVIGLFRAALGEAKENELLGRLDAATGR